MVIMPEMSGLARAFCTSLPYRALARWALLPWALQGLSPRGKALEIGSGSGAMAAQLLRRFPELHVVATDYDPEMVATARRNLAPFGERATAQRVDATALPFADGRFDVALSFAMLHHVVDWERAIAEVIRVIRPGGYLVGYDLLHAAPSRHSHHNERGSMRMMGPGQLEAELGHLPVSDVRTRRSAGGFALRFFATKA
jgi:ubiquinone/menaquinone biosynthesis C-methylase UbiE